MATVPYVKQTWTDGSSSASAARLTVIENGINDVSLAPAVRAFHNANQSIVSGTVTALALNSERYDQAGGAADTMHDTVTNNSRLTCRYAGVYIISGSAQFAVNATGRRVMQIRLNGTTVIGPYSEATPSGTFNTDMQVTTQYALAVNDYVELVVLQDSGGALNVLATGNYSPEFMMVRVA